MELIKLKWKVFCAKNIYGAKNGDNDTELVMRYYKGRKTFNELNRCKFYQIEVNIVERKLPILNLLMNLKSLGEARVNESVLDVTSDFRRLQLSLVHEFSTTAGYVRDGTFLSNGEFIFSTRKSGRWESSNDKCFVYSSNWECTKEIESLSAPFGIFQKGNEVLIGCTGSKVIEVKSLCTYNKIKTIRVSRAIFGIAFLKSYFFEACDDRIVKVDLSGVKVRDVNTGTSVKHITATNDHIVFGNRKTNLVTCMDSMGRNIWSYSSVSLKSPCGIDKDADNNIYVAGKESDNVHVLSCHGELIRIFEDIPRPDFMKIDKGRKFCCVSSNRKYLRVFEFK
ncbi:uncharacterized protein LOC133198246 [Saccostrea echinata]|uniref:uncharacterized protein LOC133198246 n=1 Tax=Saccostrea echinata TaxID=191078 RepID=UPI002A7FA19E|nr:uncharacterized protein LOC133198246 [Saccostrea echinata]